MARFPIYAPPLHPNITSARAGRNKRRETQTVALSDERGKLIFNSLRSAVSEFGSYMITAACCLEGRKEGRKEGCCIEWGHRRSRGHRNLPGSRAARRAGGLAGRHALDPMLRTHITVGGLLVLP
jgi:hypothetical protein